MVMASYEMAASDHDLLNNPDSESNILESTLGMVGNVAKSVTLGVGEGVSEILNIPSTVGNMLGADMERIDYNTFLQDIDDDLSKYYNQHKMGIDTIGFVASSVLPYSVGAKVVRGGQAVLRTAVSEGTFGTGIGRSVGLLAPDSPRNLSAAISAIRSSGDVFKLTEANTLRTLAAGFGQSALESAGGELLIAATLNQSPVLDQMSASDLAWNAAIGTGIGGILGGVIGGVSSVAAIKRAGLEAERELLPYAARGTVAPDAMHSDAILFKLDQLSRLPETPLTGDLADRSMRVAQQTREKLWTEIRSDFGKLTGGDESVAESMFQVAKLNGLDKNLANLLDVSAAGRLGTVTDVERKLKALEKQVTSGGRDLITMTPEELNLWNNLRVSYVKTYGPGAGDIVTERPAIGSIVDELGKKDTIELVRNGIKVGNTVIAHENNPYRPYNILAMGHKKTESRYWWAEKLSPWADDMKAAEPIHMVHATDLPLLQKAYVDGLPRVKVIPESGLIEDAFTLHSNQDIKDFLVSQKKSLGDRLLKAAPSQITASEFVDKFKSLFGIDFNLVDGDGSYYGFFTKFFGVKPIFGKDMNMAFDAIAIDKTAALTTPLIRLVQTLKHEEGHRTFEALLSARGVSMSNMATRLPQLHKELAKIGNLVRKPYYDKNFTKLDPAVLLHEYFADTFWYLSRHPEQAKKFPEVNSMIGHLVKPIPQEVLDAVAKRATKITPEEAAKIVDVEPQWLDGSMQRVGGEFARKTAREEYVKRLKDAGVRDTQIPADPLMLPSHVKVVHSVRDSLKDVDGNIAQGMAKVKAATTLFDQDAKRRATGILGEELPTFDDKDFLLSSGAGPGFASFADGAYNSVVSKMQYVGQRVDAISKRFKEQSSELFTPTLSNLANDLDAAIEFSVLNEKLRNLPNVFRLSDDGMSLIHSGTDKEIEEAIMNGIPTSFEIKSPHVRQLMADHITRNDSRLASRKIIRAGEGLQDNMRSGVFYPIPRSPKDTPHFAFVVDDSITGVGHSKMVYAADAQGLETMMREIREKMPEVKVLTKAESEAYFKSQGQFEFERSINENWINNQMARRGVSSSYLPMTDPTRIVQSFLDWHLARDTNIVREAVSHQYARQFEGLRRAAGESLNAETSKFNYNGAWTQIESAVNNPANSLIKMALNIQNTNEYPIWSTMNRILDQQFSSVFSKAGAVLSDATTPEHLEAVTSALKAAGYNGITQISEPLYNAMNASVPKGALTSFINKANGLISTFALRMDPLNAMNNLIGSQVLYGTEVRSLLRAIEKGDPEGAGKLAELMKVRAPGSDSLFTSPGKLFTRAVNRYFENPKLPDGTTLKDYYKQHGFITSISEQYDQTMDLLAISATDNISSMNRRIGEAMKKARGLGDKAERFTGNRFAEEMNRFVAADTMKQITDIAVAKGIIDEAEALTYINTFVNRTQGNFLASQRPMMFQGPIGQAMGLFQTYQFNMIQQLLRHVGDGKTRNALTMLGMQSSIYGANGLPGFAALNTHIIGSAPGNTDNSDMYKATYNLAGKDAGDWLMYGLGSNWMSFIHPDLKTNLYSRGDINPRNISIVPASPLDYPVVQATAKLVSNMYESSQKIGAGAGVWDTFLRAVEHNGISRPLAGMAQVLGGVTSADGKVTSTSGKGNILMAHDWYNLASVVRMAGGKPLDEAITNDALFRFTAVASDKAKQTQVLGEAIKQGILGGHEPDAQQMRDFNETYVKNGGKQQDFAKFYLRQYKNATVPQAEQLRNKLSSSFNTSYQEIMGGYRLENLSDVNAGNAP